MTKPLLLLLFFSLCALAFALTDTFGDRAMSRRVEALELKVSWMYGYLTQETNSRPTYTVGLLATNLVTFSYAGVITNNVLTKREADAIAANNGPAWAWTPKPSRTNAPVDLIPDDELIPSLRVDHWPLTTNWTGIAIIHTNRTKVGIGQRSDGVLVWRVTQ